MIHNYTIIRAYIRIRELVKDIAVALLACSLISLCSCSRKIIDTSENVTTGHATEVVANTETSTTKTSAQEEWWEATTTEQSYSAPDSTGTQYITKVVTIEAKGGKTIRDTIYIYNVDSVYISQRDTTTYNYECHEKKVGNTFNSYLYILLIVIVLIGVLVFRHRKKFNG